jgi:hypothetical protein
MTVTIEISDIQEIAQLLEVLKAWNIKSVKVQSSPTLAQPTLTKGDKSLSPNTFFGIWKDHPRTIDRVRSTGWNRDWNI